MSKSVILFVDDEKTILVSLRTQVRAYFGDRFVYETAESAEEALELIDELDADSQTIILVVSDWLMPGLKGDEFLIRVHKRFPNIKKILLTGQADEDAIERAKSEADLDRFLSKPWVDTDIVRSIIEVLELPTDTHTPQ